MIVKLGLLFFTLLIIVITLLPLARSDYWVFRIVEYLRLQKLVAGLMLGIIVICARSFLDGWFWWLLIPLGICMIYLCVNVFPYTPLSTKEMDGPALSNPGAELKIFTANVLMDNRKYDEMLQQISTQDPDIIFLVETDKKWEKAVDTLSKKYNYSLKHPLDNTYGLLFYSRLEVAESKVNFLVKDDVPSVEATLFLANGTPVKLYGLHPEPPVPFEAHHSTAKDKELMKVALAIEHFKGPCIVIGDLNDVAWSHVTELFREVSGLLDPRIGRGFYSTFSANRWWMRFPLDYIFCSSNFILQRMKKMPYNGSDHFAMFIHIQYKPENTQAKKKPDREEKEEAVDKASKEPKD